MVAVLVERVERGGRGELMVQVVDLLMLMVAVVVVIMAVVEVMLLLHVVGRRKLAMLA